MVDPWVLKLSAVSALQSVSWCVIVKQFYKLIKIVIFVENVCSKFRLKLLLSKKYTYILKCGVRTNYIYIYYDKLGSNALFIYNNRTEFIIKLMEGSLPPPHNNNMETYQPYPAMYPPGTPGMGQPPGQMPPVIIP